ncbi:MAG: acetyl-CoA carboxylase carboxyl transferase subunit alpha, partial [Pseudomonadota bacterium]|nr:acetyl-CoA carboxylase carboxyl transferase subunit alpha [Pseudomonadota bacterium]
MSTKTVFLDFEQPIARLMDKIEELGHVQEGSSEMDIAEEIERLQIKRVGLTQQIYNKLTAW